MYYDEMTTEGIYYDVGTNPTLHKWEIPKRSNHIKLLEDFLKADPIGSDLIKNWEHFVDVHIGAQLSRLKFPVKNSDNIYVPSHVMISHPTYCSDGDKVKPLWPSMARKLELSYCIRIYAYFTEYDSKQYEEYLKDPSLPIDVISQSTSPTVIAELPCMLRSKYCYTHGLSNAELNSRGEMMDNPGCYFIISGKEYFIRMIELCRTNYPLIFDRKANKGGPACSITVDLIESSIVTNVVTGTSNPAETNNSNDNVQIIGLTLQGVNRTTDEVKKRSIVTNFITVIRAMGIIYGIESMKNSRDILMVMRTLTSGSNWKRMEYVLASTILDDMKHSSKDDVMKFLLVQFDEVPKDSREVSVQFKDFPTMDDRQERVRQLLNSHVISIPGINPMERICSILFMVSNYVEFKAGLRGLTDRDVWKYKRISGPDRAFRIAFRKLLNLHYSSAHGILSKIKNSDMPFIEDVNRIDGIWKGQTLEGVCGNGKISGAFIRQFKMSCWGGGNQGSQTLSQLMSVLGNSMSIMTEIMKIYTSIEPKALVLGPRSHKPSQLAYVGVATPATRQCGLAKESAITCRVTHNKPPTEVLQALQPYLIRYANSSSSNYDKLVEMIETEDGIDYEEVSMGELQDRKMSRVLVNGIFRGWVDGAKTRAMLVKLRREGKLDKHVSIYLDNYMDMFIHTDEGRVVRPLLILDENQELIITKNNWWGRPIQFLVNNGAIEYLDPMEIESCRVAETPAKINEHKEEIAKVRESIGELTEKIQRLLKRISQLKKSDDYTKLMKQFYKEDKKKYTEIPPIRECIHNYQSLISDLQDLMRIDEERLQILKNPLNRYTHCEIHPSTQLDVAASNVPLMQHSQASKVVGQANMTRQATTGETGFTSTYRGSATRIGSFFLNRPLVSTVMERMHGAYSNSVIVMFYTLRGETIEDSVIINRNSLSRLKTFKTFTISVVISGTSSKKGDTGNITLEKPKLESMNPEEREKYKWLEDNGLPFINAPLQIGDAMVGITRSSTLAYAGKIDNVSRMVKPGEEGIVHRINVMRVKKPNGKEYQKVVNITIRRLAIPIRGDKFTTRNGQKVTIGKIVDPEFMPRTKNGAIADIVYNSHYIKRMTINFIYEMLLGRKALLEGQAVDATPFEESDIEEVKKFLIESGFTHPGYEKILVPDKDGNLVEAEGEAYIGPAALQQLKHQAAAAYRVRAEGPTDPATRQGSKGGDNPALKMNRHDHAAHDRNKQLRVLIEDVMKKTDSCPIAYCTECKLIATSTSDLEGPSCALCKSNKSMAKTRVPFSTIRLMYFLSVAGLGLFMGADRKDILSKIGINMEDQSGDESDEDVKDGEDEYLSGDEYYEDADDDESIMKASENVDVMKDFYGDNDQFDLEDEMIFDIDDEFQLDDQDD
jgi:DNA-directed RNA polymerase beta subunit